MAEPRNFVTKGETFGIIHSESTCFQLDPFHRNKAVKEKIHNRKAVRDLTHFR